MKMMRQDETGVRYGMLVRQEDKDRPEGTGVKSHQKATDLNDPAAAITTVQKIFLLYKPSIICDRKSG